MTDRAVATAIRQEPAPDRRHPFDEALVEGANTYAEALINITASDGQTDEVIGQLEAIRSDILEKYPQFAELLVSSSLSVAEKDRILADAFEGKCHPLAANFLRVLNRRNRLDLLGLILDRARELWESRQGRVPVTVRSAVPLTDDLLDALKARLSSLLNGATPVLHSEVDPDLVGGLVVQMGDRVFDASIRNRLDSLRKRLIEEKIHEIRADKRNYSSDD